MKLLIKIVALILGFVMLAGLVNAFAGNNIQDFLNDNAGRKEIRVVPGDSLWSIAQGLQCAEGHNMNMIVSALKTLNNLESSSLKTGQVIIVPTKEVN